MSKIAMNVAGGYMRGEITKMIDDNPASTPLDVLTRWLDRRYGNFIRNHINPRTRQNAFVGPFLIGDVAIVDGQGSFTITFDNANDEDYFVANVGGKVVPLESDNAS